MTNKLTAIALAAFFALSALTIFAVGAHADDEEDLGDAAHDATDSGEEAGVLDEGTDTTDIPLLTDDDDDDDDGDG